MRGEKQRHLSSGKIPSPADWKSAIQSRPVGRNLRYAEFEMRLMRHFLYKWVLWIILLSSWSLSALYAEESFTIVLHRPQPGAGQEFQIKAKVRKGQRISA